MVVPIRSVRGWLLWALLVSPLLGMSVARAHSEAALSTFIAANNLYDEGKFSEAAQAYEKILASGRRSAALYFNLGNALFKSAQIGSSIAAYRNAERLDLPASAITEAVIDEHLRPRELPEIIIGPLHELFQLCNLARYAPIKSSQELAAIVPKFERVVGSLQSLKL